MSIQRFFNQSILIKRLSTVSGYKQSFQSTATVDGHIQEMDRVAAEKIGIVDQRAWISWFNVDCIITEGDVVVDERGTEYIVSDITIKDYGINQHKQVILQEPNE